MITVVEIVDEVVAEDAVEIEIEEMVKDVSIDQDQMVKNVSIDQDLKKVMLLLQNQKVMLQSLKKPHLLMLPLLHQNLWKKDAHRVTDHKVIAHNVVANKEVVVDEVKVVEDQQPVADLEQNLFLHQNSMTRQLFHL